MITEQQEIIRGLAPLVNDVKKLKALIDYCDLKVSLCHKGLEQALTIEAVKELQGKIKAYQEISKLSDIVQGEVRNSK